MWLRSAPADLTWIIGPGLVATVAVMFLPATDPPPAWVYVVCVLLVDVAHVYATLFRTYLDPRKRREWRRLLVGVPIGCTVALLAVQVLLPTLLWTVLAYLAAFHFVRQVVGFGMLYRAKAGLPMAGPAARAERAALYAVTVYPLFWWHLHLPQPFVWFVPGDFVALPVGTAGAWLALVGAGVAALALGAHAWYRLSSRRWSPGRDLWLLSSAVVWFGGIMVASNDLAFTVSNTIAHGVPYFALVILVRRPSSEGGASWLGPALLVVATAVLLAVVEEGLWDRLVWHDREWLFGTGTPPPWLVWLAVPLLAVPQTTHYVLDRYIWQIRKDRDLRGSLGLN